jgi:hypothetical protein
MWKAQQQLLRSSTRACWRVSKVGQVKGWKVQQIVFVGGTCGSIHVESRIIQQKHEGIWGP